MAIRPLYSSDQNPHSMKALDTGLLVPFLLLGLHAQGQTLDHAGVSPQVGSSFTINQADHSAPGSGGAGQTWNFATLGVNSAATSTYVAPASTPYAASFPGATLAMDAGGGNFAYYQASSAGQDLHGLYSGTLGTNMTYQNPQRTLSYPCSYNSTWNDAFSSTFTAMGLNCTRSGTITGLADGHGTLVMPYGTMTNILRVRTVEDYSDDLGGAGTIDYDFTTYYYYKPGVRVPLLVIYEQTSTIAGQAPTNTLGISWAAGSSVGIQEALRNAIGIEVFPNPARDHASISFSSPGGNLFLEVLDATGQVVRKERLSGQPMGIGRSDLDVSGLTAGLYMLRITAPNGDQGVQRLIVQ